MTCLWAPWSKLRPWKRSTIGKELDIITILLKSNLHLGSEHKRYIWSLVLISRGYMSPDGNYNAWSLLPYQQDSGVLGLEIKWYFTFGPGMEFIFPVQSCKISQVVKGILLPWGSSLCWGCFFHPFFSSLLPLFSYLLWAIIPSWQTGFWSKVEKWLIWDFLAGVFSLPSLVMK